MFLGKFARTLDARYRATMPPAFQADLTRGAYMTQGFDRNLQVLTADAFRQLYSHAASLNLTDPLARLALRLLIGNALELGTVKGFITIPDSLRAYAGIQDNVLLIGQGDYFEVWEPTEWQKQEIQLQDVDMNATRFSALQLGTRENPHV